MRHFKSVGHMKHLLNSDMEGVQQAALDELNKDYVAEEVARLSTAGTRATKSVDADQPLRKGFVAMMLIVESL